MKLLTVFTPTYNRENTLKRVYDSLVNQTNSNFEWLIIDDGSTDNTEELVKGWINEDKITINFIKQTNSGKAKSINKSLRFTKTPLWVCLDSDDYFTKTAVEIILTNYDSIKYNDYVCGMIALRSNEKGEPMNGKEIPNFLKYTTQSHLRYNLNIKPEYAQVYKVSILKKYLYPEIPSENYFPLSYIADQLDQTYKLLVIQEPIMVIEYQDDGITKNNTRHVIKNPIGQTIFRHQQIQYSANFLMKLKAAIVYNSASMLSKKRYSFEKLSDKLIVILTYPFGIMDYIIRFRKKFNAKS